MNNTININNIYYTCNILYYPFKIVENTRYLTLIIIFFNYINSMPVSLFVNMFYQEFKQNFLKKVFVVTTFCFLFLLFINTKKVFVILKKKALFYKQRRYNINNINNINKTII